MKEHKYMIFWFALLYSILLLLFFVTDTFQTEILEADVDSQLMFDYPLAQSQSIFDQQDVIRMISVFFRTEDKIKLKTITQGEDEIMIVVQDIHLKDFKSAFDFYCQAIIYASEQGIHFGEETIDRSFYNIISHLPKSFALDRRQYDQVLKNVTYTSGFDLYKIDRDNVYVKYTTGYAFDNMIDGYTLIVLRDDSTTQLLIDSENNFEMDKSYSYLEQNLMMKHIQNKDREQMIYNMYIKMIDDNTSRVDDVLNGEKYMLLRRNE